MSTCAGHHHEPDHDPTLASCCQRDLAQQAHDWKRLQRLQAADCSTIRTDMTATILATPNRIDPQPPSQESSDFSSEDEAGEAHICHLRKRRSPRRMLTYCYMFCRAAALQSYAVATAEARTAAKNVIGVARAWCTHRDFSDTLTGKQVHSP